VAALVALEVSGGAAFLHGSAGRSALLFSLGVVTAVPLLLFAVAAQRIPLTVLGLLQYLTPTLQLLCGVVVLGEELTASRLAGFALVWVALIVLATDAFHSSRRPAGAAEPIVVPELA
jgi:chloramphenicol-sensitive protein RarD